MVDKNVKICVSELAELGCDLCPKHYRKKSGPSGVHGETAPDLNQQGFYKISSQVLHDLLICHCCTDVQTALLLFINTESQSNMERLCH